MLTLTQFLRMVNILCVCRHGCT